MINLAFFFYSTLGIFLYGNKNQLTAGFALIAKTGINKINMEWPIKVNYWPPPRTN